jgi:hypothetical protein
MAARSPTRSLPWLSSTFFFAHRSYYALRAALSSMVVTGSFQTGKAPDDIGPSDVPRGIASPRRRCETRFVNRISYAECRPQLFR